MGDVAAKAGVSLKTVSRVVNAEQHVSAALAGRVHRAISELGYLPDRRARDLAGARPSTGRLIGFVQVDAGNPFFAAVYRGLEDVTREQGLLIIAGSTDADPAREAALIETLAEFRVEGLVVAAAEGRDEMLQREIARGTPVVCVDRVLPDLWCDTVVSSNRTSMCAAVVHLHGMGHRRIAFLGGDQRVWTAAERRAGYHEGLRACGLAADPDLDVVSVDDVGRADDATGRLLSMATPPTALVTAEERITTGAVTSLHRLGRQHDVALIGYDEIPFSEQLRPAVAVAAQDPYRMGCHAGELLLDRLAGTGAAEPARVVVDAPLRLRDSGNIRPPS